MRRTIDSRPPMGPFPWLAVVLVAACAVDGDEDDDDGPPPPTEVDLYVSNNGTSNRGDVDLYDEMFRHVQRFLAGNNQGLEADIARNMLQAGEGDGKSPGGIRFITSIRSAPDNDPFDLSMDRELGGPGTTQTGLASPHGIAIAPLEGLLFVAESSTNEILVFGTAAGGDAPPFARTVLDPFSPWDLAYDGITDRLFVTTNQGSILVVDQYVRGGFGPTGPDRTIYPSDGVAPIGRHLRGIVYDFALDGIVVTDLGAAGAGEGPGFDTDGALYVLFGASAIDGLTEPDAIISGSASLLGNPVDCLLVNDDLYVAEKANDSLLRFDDIFFEPAESPIVSTTEVGAESLEGIKPTAILDPDVTDIDTLSTLILSVATTSNPTAMDPAFGEYARVTTDLALQLGTMDLSTGLGESSISLENVGFDANGDAFITFDDGADQNGGVLIVNRISRARTSAPSLTPSRDRLLHGPATTLVSPKGVEIIGALGWLLVADHDAGSPAVVCFGAQAGGDVPPAFSVDLSDYGRPWDLDYDPNGDRLFVVLTNGQVAVFDDFTQDRGVSGPDRMIQPFVGEKEPTPALRGIVHTGNQLILSDVGVVDDAADGQLLVLSEASTANGPSPVVRRILGLGTLLGDPTDLAFDGVNVYVAERAGDLILRFDEILVGPSGDIPPVVQIARTKPESVALVPSFLSRTPSL